MKRLIPYIQQHLSLRLGLLIVFIVTVVFTLLFNYLLYRCRHFIQNAAIERATQLPFPHRYGYLHGAQFLPREGTLLLCLFTT